MYKVTTRHWRYGDEIVMKFKSNQLIDGAIPIAGFDVFTKLDEISNNGHKVHECIRQICDQLQPYCYYIEVISSGISAIYEK